MDIFIATIKALLARLTSSRLYLKQLYTIQLISDYLNIATQDKQSTLFREGEVII
jgi:hypothetical protein